MNKKIIFFAIIFAGAVILAVPKTSFAGLTDWFKGWSWSPNIGWVSFNSTNLGLTADYGVTVNPESANSVTGWAWSSNIGWICFGSTCINANNSSLCPSQWTSFLGTASPAAAVATATQPYQLTGWARLFSQDFGSDTSLTTSERCNQGWISLNCSNKGTCATSDYNVNVDTSNGFALNGYAWSSTSPANYGGLGWIRFDPDYDALEYREPGVYQGTRAAVPWIQVLYGSLYAKGDVSTFTPFAETFGEVNVTYCIDTGVGATVSNVSGGTCTAETGEAPINAEQTINVNAPKLSTNYSNPFGRLDIDGLRTVNSRYGTYVKLTDTTLTDEIPSVLGGGIYDSPGSGFGTFTMEAKTFNNGAGAQNGAGVIVIRGNLNITGDIEYQVGTITKMKQLASLGILVLDDGSGTYGNVNISPDVATVSANIYAEGTISTGSTGVVATEIPLEINGVTVAKQYDFERLFPGTPDLPSEKIVYDGRIIANTPPGMNDILQSLPIISN